MKILFKIILVNLLVLGPGLHADEISSYANKFKNLEGKSIEFKKFQELKKQETLLEKRKNGLVTNAKLILEEINKLKDQDKLISFDVAKVKIDYKLQIGISDTYDYYFGNGHNKDVLFGENINGEMARFVFNSGKVDVRYLLSNGDLYFNGEYRLTNESILSRLSNNGQYTSQRKNVIKLLTDTTNTFLIYHFN